MSVDSMISQYGVTASVLRPTYPVDAVGSVISAYAPVISSLTVYIQQNGGTESSTLGGQRNTLSATAYVPVGTGILPQDRLYVGTTYWDIQEVRTPDERPSADGVAHMRLSMTRTLPL